MKTEQLLTITKTPAGIPVITERLPQTRSAAVSISVGIGSRDEGLKQHGMAHFLEHILFKGTKNHTFNQVNETIEEAGGYLNAFTTQEMTSFFSFSIDETIKTAQGLVQDIFCNPLMDKGYTELEKGVVKQEINNRLNDPERYIKNLLMRSLFKGGPLSRPVLGTGKSVDAFATEDLLEFHSTKYRPPRMAVVACGNIDEKQVLQWATESLDGLEKAKPVKRQKPKFYSSIDAYPRKGDHMYVGIAFPGLTAKDPESYAQDVLAAIIGGGASSRLNRKVREEEGLVYSIYMAPSSYSDSGTIESYFSTSGDRVQRVIQIFGEELKRLKEEGLTEGELERAKHVLKGSILRNIGQPRDDMRMFAYHYMITGDVPLIDDEVKKYEEVTENEVMKLAQQLLVRKDMTAAIYGAKTTADSTGAFAKGIDF